MALLKKLLALQQMTGECHNDIIIAQNIPLSLRRHQDDVSMFVKLWQPANKIPVGNSFICFRELLVGGGASITFIYLKGSQELIKRRLEERANHYFKAELLQSQFDTLEVSHTIKWYILGNFYLYSCTYLRNQLIQLRGQ